MSVSYNAYVTIVLIYTYVYKGIDIKMNTTSWIESMVVYKPKIKFNCYVFLLHYLIIFCTQRYLAGGNWQIRRIVGYSRKFSLPIFTDRLKMYLAYALTVVYSPNFSSPTAFTIWFAKIFPCQIFLQ